jgi:hypothetical protein
LDLLENPTDGTIVPCIDNIELCISGKKVNTEWEEPSVKTGKKDNKLQIRIRAGQGDFGLALIHRISKVLPTPVRPNL